jgi:hypothetical protein
MSVLSDPSTAPLLGYKLLPGLVSVISLMKDTFKTQDKESGKTMNLLDCLQTLTNEGTDFTRERIFETPHPYPQQDYTQSETIDVPKAIGFIVELDKRSTCEHSTDQLVIYCGTDHVFQINQNFANQIKFSNRPSTR